MTALLIDTDPAMGTLSSDPEDSFAITFAARSPEATLSAISCVQGNVPVRHSHANARHLLDLIDRPEIPLAAGREQPSNPNRRPEQLRWLAEKDAWRRVIPPAERPYPAPDAVTLISDTARDAAGDLTVVAIGPLTNIAAALTADPDLAGRIGKLVVMGGAFEVPGNITPCAEFNFWMDPDAADTVLNSGLRPLLVGLDVCNRTKLTRDQIAATGIKTDLGQFVQKSCAAWFDAMEKAGEGGLHLFDTLSVAAALIPDLLRTEPAYVRLDTGTSVAQGASAAWLPGRPSEWSRPTETANADVAVDLDLDLFTRLFADRVLAAL